MSIKSMSVLVVLCLVAVASTFKLEAVSLSGEQYKCIVHGLDLLSHSYGLERLYAQHQPELQKLLIQRLTCSTEKNAVKRKICEVTEGTKVLKKISEYVDAASSKNPKFRDEYSANVKKLCKS